MSTTPKFDLYTATAAELEAHIESDLRGKQMNFSDKLEMLSDEKFRLTSDGQLMRHWIDMDRRGRTPEVIAAHRRYSEARVAWLEKNPGDDLTPERIAFWVRLANEDLPRCQSLRIAVEWCKEVEEHHESEPERKSETYKKLASRLQDAKKEAARHLACALTIGQVDFLAAVCGRTRRTKWRFRVQWTRYGYREMHRYRLIDLEITETRRRLLFASFSWAVEHAKTLSEVKQICACWHTPYTIEMRDGSKFLVGDGFEVIPQYP